MSLVSIDPKSPAAVTHYLSEAYRWLETAVETSTPHGIFNAKAEIATAAEATKQLGLSRDIQLDAEEMVRRAEFVLSKSIAKGQADGTVSKRGDNLRGDVDVHRGGHLAAVTEFGSRAELYGNGTAPGLIALAETSNADYDAALNAAKAEGNLSRANVARKAAEQRSGPVAPAEAGTTERAHQEAELINSFGSIVRRSLTPKNVATLTPNARRRLVQILEDALNTLKETSA